MKKIIIVLIAVLVVAGCVTGFFIWRHNDKYIGRDEAVAIALEDAGLSMAEITEVDAELEKTRYSAWYEIDIETHGYEYEYSVDAVSGEILYSNSKPDN